MNKETELSYGEMPHFHLNLQILLDELAPFYRNISAYHRHMSPHLDGVRLYQKQKPLSSRYIYALKGGEADEDFLNYEDICFLCAGSTELSFFSDSCSVLIAGEESDLYGIVNIVQQTFDKYHEWERNLQFSLDSANPLDNMLAASLDIFRNPIFVHDHDFYILSCPRYVRGMLEWETDNRTGRSMVPLALIHDFRADWEYMETLNTRGSHFYSAAMRGYRILYMNLWVGTRYEGRICVDEIQNLILPGHLLALEYLGSFIELCIRQYNLFRLNMGNDITKFFADYLSGAPISGQQTETTLRLLGWRQQSRYLCLRLEADQLDEHMHSSAATIRHIEAQIRTGQAFLFQQGIVVIVNLSLERASVSEIISSLAIILREGLFKMGVSSEIPDFTLIPQGYLQSCEALRLGGMSSSMNWCYRFDDYLLEYILKESKKQLHPKLLCSNKLLELQKYDLENKTDLFHTLKTYLNLERNVLQTAKTLFIHRSTLSYRLERIQKLTRINLDDARERLVLQLSFCLLEEKNPSGEEKERT